jgi:hypothetical protein
VDQINKLESIPHWTWNPIEDARKAGFDALEKYFQKNETVLPFRK